MLSERVGHGLVLTEKYLVSKRGYELKSWANEYIIWRMDGGSLVLQNGLTFEIPNSATKCCKAHSVGKCIIRLRLSQEGDGYLLVHLYNTRQGALVAKILLINGRRSLT